MPGAFARNWQLKLLAVTLAVLLWTVPRFEAQSSRVLEDLPVRVEVGDPNWALVGSPSPPSVSVTLSGPARDLIGIAVDRPPVLIPMDEVSSPDTTVRLRSTWFRGSTREGVVVEDIRPGAVSLRFEPIEERHLGLSLPLFGNLPPGVSVAGPPRITPATVTAFGATSLFEGVDSLKLTAMDLSLVAAPGPITLPVDTTGLSGLVISPLEASVEIPTEPTVRREFQGLTIALPLLDAAPQLQSRPTAVTVVLTGAQSLVEAVDPQGLSVTIPRGRASLAPGDEERTGVVVEGIPALVEYEVIPPWVLLRRPAGQ